MISTGPSTEQKEFEKATSVKCTKEHFAKKGKSKKIAEYHNEVMQEKELRYMAQCMRKLHANLTEEGKDLGKTALHVAVEKGCILSIIYLVSIREDLNAKDKVGWTPLHYAVYSGDIGVVKLLIDNGADYNITDGEGTPVFYAFQYGRLALVKYFVEEKHIDPMMKISEYGNTLFGEATVGGDSEGNVDTIKYLIDERKAVYNANELIENIVSHGYFHTAKYLIEEKGVEPNCACENGWTLLHIATQRGSIEIVEYLLEKGAEVSSATKDGITALHIAAREHNCEVIEHLIEKGANVNVKDNEGNTPLHLAAQDYEFQNKKHQLDVVKCLVSSGAEVNAKNNDGQTAVNIATDCDVVKYLSFVNKLNGGLYE